MNTGLDENRGQFVILWWDNDGKRNIRGRLKRFCKLGEAIAFFLKTAETAKETRAYQLHRFYDGWNGMHMVCRKVNGTESR